MNALEQRIAAATQEYLNMMPVDGMLILSSDVGTFYPKSALMEAYRMGAHKGVELAKETMLANLSDSSNFNVK